MYLTLNSKVLLLKKIFLLLAFLCIQHLSFSQQTNVYLDPQISYKNGVDYFQQKEYIPAKRHFDHFLENFGQKPIPNAHRVIFLNAEYYNAICCYYLQYANADSLLRHIISTYPNTTQANRSNYFLGKLYFEQKEYEQAKHYWSSVDHSLLNKEEQPEFRFQNAYLLFLDEKYDAARKEFGAIKDIQDKYYFPSNYYYGYIAYEQKDYDIALNSFFKISESKKYSRLVPFYIASIYFQQKDYEKTINYGTKHLNDPRILYSNEIEHLVGKAYFEKKDYKKAIAHISQYIKEAKEISKYDQYQLAYAYSKTEQYRLAINNFVQLNFLEDSLGQNALYNLASCFIKIGQTREAKNAFSKASKMDYDPYIKEIATYNHAKISCEMGYEDVAIKSLQAFINDYPNSIYISEAKELLTDLFLTTRNFKDAFAVIQSIEEKSPKIKKAYQKTAYYRGVEFFNIEMYDTAIHYFNLSNNYPIDELTEALSFFWKGEALYIQENYKQAIPSYNKFIGTSRIVSGLPHNVSASSANYAIGYSFYNMEQYTQAIAYFKKAIESKQQSISTDASLRVGDCEFIIKNYASALKYYATVYESSLSGSDYALLQSGIIKGLQNNNTSKIEIISKILTQYKSSNFYDDALYETGKAFIASSNYNKAEQYFNQIITDYKQSGYVSRSLLELGLISYNLNKESEALKFYKNVVKAFPGTNEANIALRSIKDIYIASGNAQEYINFASTVPNINLSNTSQDSLTYLASEALYIKDDCAAAIKSFGKYIDGFPHGLFALPAYYYRAECLYSLKKYQKSIEDYQHIINAPYNQFKEKALVKTATLFEEEYDSSKAAYNYYEKLLMIADLKENIERAQLGLIRTGFEVGEYQSVINYTNSLNYLAGINESDIILSNLLAGKSALRLKDTMSAIQYFNVSDSITDNPLGTEARYLLAEIAYDNVLLDSSKNICLSIIKQTPSHEYWIVKSFILISDIYREKEDYFQAKATLQSIVNGYDGDEVLSALAKLKLQEIITLEEQHSKIQENEEEIIKPIELDSLDNNIESNE